MQNNGKNNIGGQLVAWAMDFLRSELAAKIAWVILSVISILAGYLSLRSTTSVLTLWSADRGLTGGMNVPVGIGLNLAILAVSFGAWHELRRKENPINAVQLARVILRKAVWAALLIFQFVWLFAPLSLVLMFVLAVPAALAFTALPFILEKTETRLFGRRMGNRINRFVIRFAGLTSMVLLPVILTFTAVDTYVDKGLTSTGFFSSAEAIFVAGALTILLAVFVFYAWGLLTTTSNWKAMWYAVRYPSRANLVNGLVSLVVLLASSTIVGVYGYTTLGGLGGAIRDNGSVTPGFAIITWQIWIVLAFMATVGPLALGYIEAWLQGFTAQSASASYSDVANDLPDLDEDEFENEQNDDGNRGGNDNDEFEEEEDSSGGGAK